MSMTSSRPYIIRALYEWILENECTPYILVNAYAEGVEVPQEHVKDGQIILNVSPAAVQNLSIRNQSIDFDGRFAGLPKRVYVPVNAVMGIYAKENGQGMIFDTEGILPDPTDPAGPDGPGSGVHGVKSEPGSRKPPLRLVK
ncbi:MAG TPA: ClpXP protease specificity-enhancing factor [Gammaproteobacteria bacterium]|jgi:stringent starvation protein B|nr:ClpXP protease specificity-enhancing factor [Gammaproteobacteria bacterium]|tara:strand:- start:30674 stop:31099 length:426 start_codon:yes stop_codon:yes gene_type:complete